VWSRRRLTKSHPRRATAASFTVRPNGSRLNLIHLDVSTGDYCAYSPVFSRDSARIVFSLNLAGAADIYSASPDGSKVQPITKEPQ
jgi:Tol biopolymer transport system component